MNASSFISVKDAPQHLGIGKNTISRLYESDPQFPRKIRLSYRVVGWRAEDLDRWLEQRAKQAGGVQQ